MEQFKLVGNHSVADQEIREKLATRETPKFLGIFTGVLFDYEIFDRYVLERDLKRIERLYRARGYYEAKARAARVYFEGRQATVEVVIREGEPVRVGRLDVYGLPSIDSQLVERVRSRVQSQLSIGQPFDEELFEAAETQALRILKDAGYARAVSKRFADVNLPRRIASVGFRFDPGPLAQLGRIQLRGLGALPEDRVRRALSLRAGDPYSQSEIEEAERAILDLGVFSSVAIGPDPAGPKTGKVVNLLVHLEPSRLRSVQLGGGVEVNALQSNLHLTAGWEDRNFLGGMRRFQVRAQPGVVLFPTRLPDFQAPERLLPIARLRVDFREPGFIEARTNALIRSEASMAPVITTPKYDPSVPVLGYRELRVSVGLERSYWRFYSALTHNLQVASPFTYLGQLHEYLGTVLISYPELFSVLDLRDDALSPQSGFYASNTLQVAGLGGDARDLKLQLETRAYTPLLRSVTLAGRVTAGLLFPGNYGDTLELNARQGLTGELDRAWTRDTQLTFLRGFFSGGPGSNRGYLPREIGPHGLVPFYNPGQTGADLFSSCDSSSPEYSAARCDLPLGGFTLWEANLELRLPLSGPLSSAIFADASDVAPAELKFRFDRLHLSLGGGLRYATPVGPVRFDLGWRVAGLQAPNEALDEGTPNRIFGLPIAISLGIGESF